MSALATEVLPATGTQVITHAWSVGRDDEFYAGYEVAVINITPDYAQRLLAMVTVINEQLPPQSILVIPDNAAHFIDEEREETFEWSEGHSDVTVLVNDERLSVFEQEPELNAGFPIRLGERYLEICQEHFRYRAERKHRDQDQCVITPDIPIAVLHDIVNETAEVKK